MSGPDADTQRGPEPESSAESAAELAAGLASSIARWPGLVGAVRRIDPGDAARLLPAEAEAIAAVAPRRAAEFATGRRLLHELVGSDEPIVRRPDRRPQLPAGWIASLAHDDDFAVAVAGPASRFETLGVDVEAVGAELDVHEAAVILRPDDEVDAEAAALVAFVIKEAVFKAWSPGSDGRVLDHHEVRLRSAGGIFEASVLVDDSTHCGWWSSAGGRWLAISVGERR